MFPEKERLPTQARSGHLVSSHTDRGDGPIAQQPPPPVRKNPSTLQSGHLLPSGRGAASTNEEEGRQVLGTPNEK